MKERTCITLKNKDTADVSSLVELAIKQFDYSSELIIRYSFIFEEVLEGWKSDYDPESEVLFKRLDSDKFMRLEISIPGEYKNPLKENTSEDILDSMVSRLKTRLGKELHYKYRDGRNYISVTLPKTNVEKTLFERNVFALSMPVILQLLLLSISSVADNVMLSFYNQTSLAAASLIAQLTVLFTSITTPMGSAMTIVFTKYWDERAFDTAYKVFTLVLKLQAMIGFVFFVFAEFLPDMVMNFYTTIPEVHAEGVLYLKAIAPYYLFTAIAEVYLCFMRNTKEVTKSSSFVIIAQIANCLINGVLIFGLLGFPEMGIKGAGISTSISGALLLVFAIIEYFRSKLLNVKLSHLVSFNPGLLKEFSKYAAPLVFQMFSYYAATNVISSLIGRTNVDAISAVAVKNTIYGMLRSIDNGTASILTLLMAPLMLPKNKEKAFKQSRLAVNYAFKTGLVMAAIFALSRLIVPFAFRNVTGQAMSYLNIIMAVATVSLFCGCMNFCTMSCSLLPSGDVKPIIIIDFIVMWVVVVGSMVLGTKVFAFPVIGLLILTCIDEIVSFPAKMGRYKSMTWYKKIK